MKYLLLFFFSLTYSFPNQLPAISGTIINSKEQLDWNWSKARLGTAVIFLSAKCPCSNSHLPSLKMLKDNYPDITFIGVHSNVDETQKETQEYFKKAELNFPVIQDDQAKTADVFKAYKTPHAYLVSKAGDILYVGGVTSSAVAKSADELYLEKALMELKAGKEITKKTTRVLGCAISRK
jgi:hypothetical protein